MLRAASGAGYGARTRRRRPGCPANAMTLHRSFRPLRPDLDRSLFAQVGNEVDGVPLSVVSARTRLGLDPWEEATRLCSFSEREAAEQLTCLLADLPGHTDRLRDTRQTAADLVSLLPEGGSSSTRMPQAQIQPRFWAENFPKLSQFWVGCLVVAAACRLAPSFTWDFRSGLEVLREMKKCQFA